MLAAGPRDQKQARPAFGYAFSEEGCGESEHGRVLAAFCVSGQPGSRKPIPGLSRPHMPARPLFCTTAVSVLARINGRLSHGGADPRDEGADRGRPLLPLWASPAAVSCVIARCRVARPTALPVRSPRR
jgi:hypothetical protein